MLSKCPPVTGGSTFWQGVWCVMGWKGASQRLGGNDHGMGCLGTRATTTLVPLQASQVSVTLTLITRLWEVTLTL